MAISSTARYVRLQKSESPAGRKVIYKLRQKELSKAAKERYERPEKIKEHLRKGVEKVLSAKRISKDVFKKEPRVTIKLTPVENRTPYFKQTYEAEKRNLLSWK